METAALILKNMKDTDDPKVGSVFEKTVEAGFEEFVRFLLSRFHSLKINQTGIPEDPIFIIYSGGDHIGTYNAAGRTGFLGGTRLGSQNPWLKPSDPLIINAFRMKVKAGRHIEGISLNPREYVLDGPDGENQWF
jgi:hypothetical protein